MGDIQIGQGLGAANSGGTLSVRLPNGKVVQARAGMPISGSNVVVLKDESGQFHAFADLKSSGSVVTKSIYRKRPRRRVAIAQDDYYFKVLQLSSIEGFDGDVALDLTGYNLGGVTNTGSGYRFGYVSSSNYLFSDGNTSSTLVTDFPLFYSGSDGFFLLETENTESHQIIYVNGHSAYGVKSYGNSTLATVSLNRLFYKSMFTFNDGSFNTNWNILTTLNGEASITGSGQSSVSRVFAFNYFQPFYECNINGSVANVFERGFYGVFNNTNNSQLIGVESVSQSFSADFRFYNTPTGAEAPNYWYYLLGQSSYSESVSLPEISNAFANPTDKTYRNYTYQENVTYGETVTSVSEYFLDIVFVYPILTGLDCSIYLKIEVETDADVVSSSVARENWQDIMGRQLSFPVYRPTDGNSTVSYNKNSIVSLVVKTPQNTYYISDFDGNNSYSFDSRFFLILRGILTGGTNSFNILYNDRLDFSGKEYEIGIRFAFPDFYYLNIKFGTYEDRILKKIDGENKTYYNTTPLNFDGVDVDIYTKENDGFVYQWSGTISSAEYDTVVSTEDRQDGSIQRRYKKFNINTTGEPTKTFFFWFNLNLNSDTVFVVPKDDYTVSLLRFFKNPNLYTSFVYDLSWSNLYAVTDENGGETVELAIAERPTDTAEKDEWRADIYRFNAATLKWERRPNAVSPLSQLTAPSDFISYHPTPSN